MAMLIIVMMRSWCNKRTSRPARQSELAWNPRAARGLPPPKQPSRLQQVQLLCLMRALYSRTCLNGVRLLSLPSPSEIPRGRGITPFRWANCCRRRLHAPACMQGRSAHPPVSPSCSGRRPRVGRPVTLKWQRPCRLRRGGRCKYRTLRLPHRAWASSCCRRSCASRTCPPRIRALWGSRAAQRRSLQARDRARRNECGNDGLDAQLHRDMCALMLHAAAASAQQRVPSVALRLASPHAVAQRAKLYPQRLAGAPLHTELCSGACRPERTSTDAATRCDKS
mmetsp:Transcript_57307/g.124494  ORF Transcript_57307/g.124494 Transcript_57307/m.124494 type:complete len:281 (-) Transcript_57307:86-928(-)